MNRERKRAKLCGEFLESRHLLSVSISEFMARNETSLMAADGERYDWIELYNDGEQTVDLEGWALTDSEDELSKWRFPAVQLAPLRYLIVFASGQAADDGALHANFRLDGDGEYLALVDDQQRVMHEFAPEFP